MPAIAQSRVLYWLPHALRKFANAEVDVGGGRIRTGAIVAMNVSVHWVSPQGMSFLAETGSGHLVAMDGAADGGGRNLAPRPMELMLAGAGGCTAYDVVLILRRGRHEVSGCEVRLQAERATTDPKVFTRIVFHFVVRGRDLPKEAVERAVRLSHDKYCSATAMLAKTAEIVTTIEVQEQT